MRDANPGLLASRSRLRRVPPSAAELASLLSSLPPDQRSALLDANRSGFDLQLGLRYESAQDERVVATLAVTQDHLQPYGLVHGGVYATMVESVCSVGAALRELTRGHNAVGIENTTRFIRGTRVGARLRAEAVPAVAPAEDRARWEATITNEAGEVCATGRLVLAILAPGATVGGEAISLPRVEVPDTD